jgi:hypothetical protein
MSSLNILNRSTKSNGGGGLPFYNNNLYTFSANNNGFNSAVGLWSVPPDKIPTFQIFTDGIYNTVITRLQRFNIYKRSEIIFIRGYFRPQLAR